MRADAWSLEDPTLCASCKREAIDARVPDSAEEAAYKVRVGEAVVTERVKREARRYVDLEEHPPVPPPIGLTLRERLARPVTATPWRIQHWQARESRILLSAQFKAGKTTLRDNYIRSKVDGDPFLGRDPVTPIEGRVMLVDFEMGDRKLDQWLRPQCIRDDDRVVVFTLRHCAGSFNLLDDRVRAEWANRFRALDAEDLVLDCLRPVLDALGLDEQRDAGRFLVAFDQLLREAGIPEALVVTHMGHHNERARGDSRLRDWPDAEWRLVRKDDTPNSTRFITAYGRDVEVPESELEFDSLSRHLTIKDGSRVDARRRDALEAIVGALDGQPPMSGRQIKEALADSGHARDTIDAALSLGVREHTLVQQEGPRHAKLYRRAGA